MMTELDWFGHWGYAFIAVGMWFLHTKDPRGWAIRLFGEMIWTWIGVMLGMTSIWMWGIVFMAIDIQGFFRWKTEEKAKLAMDHWIAEAEQYLGSLFRDTDIKDKVTFPATVGKRMVATINGDIEDDEGYWMAAGNPINENVKLQGKGQNMATGSSRSRKSKVRATRGRRSVKADGKPRSRSDAKPKGAKRSRSNVRVQKNNRRTNTRRTKASKG